MTAFDELYKTYYRQVFLYLLDLCKDPDLAEEIAQETFFKVLKKIDTFEGKSSIGTWMLQIAKNHFYNYCKKKKYENVEDWESIPAKDNPENRALDKDPYYGFVYAMVPESGEMSVTYVGIVFCNHFLDLDIGDYMKEEYLLPGFDATLHNPYEQKIMGK